MRPHTAGAGGAGVKGRLPEFESKWIRKYPLPQEGGGGLMREGKSPRRLERPHTSMPTTLSSVRTNNTSPKGGGGAHHVHEGGQVRGADTLRIWSADVLPGVHHDSSPDEKMRPDPANSGAGGDESVAHHGRKQGSSAQPIIRRSGDASGALCEGGVDILRVDSSEDEADEEELGNMSVEELREKLGRARATKDRAMTRACDAEKAREEYKSMMEETVELAQRWRDKHTHDQAISGIRHRDMPLEDFLALAARNSRSLESRRGILVLRENLSSPVSRSGTVDFLVSALEPLHSQSRPRTSSLSRPRTSSLSRPRTTTFARGTRLGWSNPMSLPGTPRGRAVPGEVVLVTSPTPEVGSFAIPRYGVPSPDTVAAGVERRELSRGGAEKRESPPSRGRSRSPIKDDLFEMQQPRFWGKGGRVEKLSLENLRQLLRSLGDEDRGGGVHVHVADHHEKQEGTRLARLQRKMESERREIEAFRAKSARLEEFLFGGKRMETTQEVVDAVETMMPQVMVCDAATVYFIERDTRLFHCMSRHVTKKAIELPVRTGGMGEALASQKTCIINNWAGSPVFSSELDEATNLMRVSCMSTPCQDEHRQIVAVIEVCQTSAVPRVFHRMDASLLELGCTLFMHALARMDLARLFAQERRVTEVLVSSVQRVADAQLAQTVHDLSQRCREQLKARTVTVWMIDERDRSKMYNNTVDDKDCRGKQVGVGIVGCCAQSRLLENLGSSRLETVVLVVPVLDKKSQCLAVMEFNGKTPPERDMWQWGPQESRHVRSEACFSKQDEQLALAFSVVLANFLENAQWTISMREQMRHLNAITAAE